MTRYFAPQALLPHGWESDVTIAVDERGDIASVTPSSDAAGAERLAGAVVPGMPNLHSHAAQRALAGRTERGTPGSSDTFWSWREAMYGFVDRVDPDQFRAIAAQVYVEMLKAGYTAVGEFHYLHHDRDGARFGRSTEMGERVAVAASTAGIGLTLLPVLYVYGGFGARAASERQRRFLMTPDEFVAYWDDLAVALPPQSDVRIGAAPHSLRAVGPEHLQQLVAHVARRDARAPIHIHVAEQRAEVDDCLAWSGMRPVTWLLAHAPVSSHWCLVHATHADDGELAAIAKSGAVVGLCPTTEANLGDGIFAAERFVRLGGTFGVGSDSNVTVDVAEELRWLEYGQRLASQRRAILCDDDTPSVGATLYRRALAGGAQALGRSVGAIAAGMRADLVVLEPGVVAAGDDALDRFVFVDGKAAVRDVIVGGRWVVRERKHAAEERVEREYRAALRELFG